MDVLITEFIDDGGREALEAEFEVHYDPTLAERREELLERAADCRALVVRNRTRVDEALLDACTRLRVVGRLGVGLDNIDVAACRARGIPVHPAAGANVVAVAEYVIAAILVLLRGAFEATAEVLAGEWPRTRYIGREAHGKRLGVVGFGAIGRAVASRARALGMHVSAHDAYLDEADPAWREAEVEPLGLPELLAASDAVTLHVPLDESTRHLVDAAALARMKPSAILVNTARGGVVDEAALAEALRSGRLAGAALDVFETEPLPAGSALEDVPRLMLTPHVAGLTVEANERTGAMIAASVARTLREGS